MQKRKGAENSAPLFLRVITFSLGGKEIVIVAFPIHKLLMCADFNNLAVAEDDNLACGHGAGETVGDEDGEFITGELGKLVEDLLLRNSVEGCGRLIEDKNVGVLIEGTSDRKLLPLAARKLNSVILKESGEGGIISTGQVTDEAVCTCVLCGKSNLVRISSLVSIAKGNVVADRLGIFTEVLEDDPVEIVERGEIILTDISSVKENHSLGGIVESGEKLNECSLTCAIQADEDNRLICSQGEVNILKNVSITTGVAEGNVLKLDDVLYATLWLNRLGCGSDNGGILVHKVDHIVNEESSLVDHRGGGKDCSNTAGD